MDQTARVLAVYLLDNFKNYYELYDLEIKSYPTPLYLEFK